MAIFKAYFDASGHPDDTGEGSSMFVSGWISTADKWAKFERLWLALLDENGIRLGKDGQPKPFHMNQFQAGKGIYKELRQDEERYRAFKNTAVNLMTRYTHKGISIGVVIPHLQRLYREYEVPAGLPENSNPYPWCGIQAVHQVYRWMANRLTAKKRTAKPTDQIEIIFQYGDLHQGELLALAKAQYGHAPAIVDTAEAVPFQACDFLAWEHRNWLSVRTRMADQMPKPSYINVQLARRLAFDSQLYANWDTLHRKAERDGWVRR